MDINTPLYMEIIPYIGLRQTFSVIFYITLVQVMYNNKTNNVKLSFIFFRNENTIQINLLAQSTVYINCEDNPILLDDIDKFLYFTLHYHMNELCVHAEIKRQV